MIEDKMCFVIMPISDPEGYETGHFKFVYEDIFKPAIKEAGFQPKRADDDTSSSMIQVNIVKDIIEAPMAICDLSTRNPNVLFELGIRQAFDLPVVLVQEQGTPRIFDISTINTIDYHKKLIYREVLEDRENIQRAIESTKDNQKGINSIIKLLRTQNAKIETDSNNFGIDDIKVMLFALSNQIDNIKENKYGRGEKNIYTDSGEIVFDNFRVAFNSYEKELKSLSSESNIAIKQKKVEDIMRNIQTTYSRILANKLLDKKQKKEFIEIYNNVIRIGNGI